MWMDLKGSVRCDLEFQKGPNSIRTLRKLILIKILQYYFGVWLFFLFFLDLSHR